MFSHLECKKKSISSQEQKSQNSKCPLYVHCWKCPCLAGEVTIPLLGDSALPLCPFASYVPGPVSCVPVLAPCLLGCQFPGLSMNSCFW